MNNRKRLADELTAILNDARFEYAGCQERDRVKQARNGAEHIQVRGFAYDDIRAEASGVVNLARERALNAIDRQICRTESMLIEPPSADELSYITGIRGRTDLSRDEMNAALSRYKSHAAQKAILSAAAASELISGTRETREERDLSDLRTLRDNVCQTYTSADFDNMTDGRASFTKAAYRSFGDGNSCDDAVATFSSLCGE